MYILDPLAPAVPPVSLGFGLMAASAFIGVFFIVLMTINSKMELQEQLRNLPDTDPNKLIVPPDHVNDPEDGALTLYNIFGIGRKPKQ